MPTKTQPHQPLIHAITSIHMLLFSTRTSFEHGHTILKVIKEIPHTFPSKLPEDATADEIMGNILRNTFDIANLYFIDPEFYHNEIGSSYDLKKSFTSLFEALAKLKNTTLQQDDLPKEVIEVLELCLKLCPEEQKKSSPLNEHEDFLEKYFPSIHKSYFTDNQFFPFLTREDKIYIELIRNEQGYLLTSIRNNQTSLTKFHIEHRANALKQILKHIAKPSDSFLKAVTLYEDQLTSTFAKITCNALHASKEDISNDVHLSFKLLDNIFKTDNNLEIILHLYKHTRFEAIIKLLEYIPVDEKFIFHKSDIITIFKAVNFLYCYYPESSALERLNGLYLDAAYQYNHSHPDDKLPINMFTYSLNTKNDFVNQFIRLEEALSNDISILNNKEFIKFVEEKALDPKADLITLSFSEIFTVINIFNDICNKVITNNTQKHSDLYRDNLKKLVQFINNYLPLFCKPIEPSSEPLDDIFKIKLAMDTFFKRSLRTVVNPQYSSSIIIQHELANRLESSLTSHLKWLHRFLAEKNGTPLNKSETIIIEKIILDIANRVKMNSSESSDIEFYFIQVDALLKHLSKYIADFKSPLLKLYDSLFLSFLSKDSIVLSHCIATYYLELSEKSKDPDLMVYAKFIKQLHVFLEEYESKNVSEAIGHTKKYFLKQQWILQQLNKNLESFSEYPEKILIPNGEISKSLINKILRVQSSLLKFSGYSEFKLATHFKNMVTLLLGKTLEVKSQEFHSLIETKVSPSTQKTTPAPLPTEKKIKDFFDILNSKKHISDTALLKQFKLILNEIPSERHTHFLNILFNKLIQRLNNRKSLCKKIFTIVINFLYQENASHTFEIYSKYLYLNYKLNDSIASENTLLAHYYATSHKDTPIYLTDAPKLEEAETVSYTDYAIPTKIKRPLEMIATQREEQFNALQREKEKQLRKLEQERKQKEQRQRQLELERKQKEEKQRQLELERKQEENKQRQLELERKQKEEKQRQLELERKQEEEKQRQLELERKQEEEKQRQLELVRKQVEDKQRQLELERKQEEDYPSLSSNVAPLQLPLFFPHMESISLHPNIQNIFQGIPVQVLEKFYLVGGATRDLLLKRSPKDYDFVFHGSMNDLIECLRSYKIEFSMKGSKLHPQVQIQALNEYHLPCVLEISAVDNLVKNALGRDLTINAIYWNLATHVFVDPTNGLADIKSKQFNLIGLEPKQRFLDDPTIILRLFKLMARLPSFKLSKSLRKCLTSQLLPNFFQQFITNDTSNYHMAAKSKLRNSIMKEILSEDKNTLNILTVYTAFGLNPLLTSNQDLQISFENFASLKQPLWNKLTGPERFCYFYAELISLLSRVQPQIHFNSLLATFKSMFFINKSEMFILTQLVQSLHTGYNTLQGQSYDSYPNLNQLIINCGLMNSNYQLHNN